MRSISFVFARFTRSSGSTPCFLLLCWQPGLALQPLPTKREVCTRRTASLLVPASLLDGEVWVAVRMRCSTRSRTADEVWLDRHRISEEPQIFKCPHVKPCVESCLCEQIGMCSR